MNMITTEEAAARITGTCYAQQQIIAHNKYLPLFFVCNNNNLIYYHHISLLLSIVVALLCLEGYNVYA
jgi:hypothetical protein